MKLSFNCLSHSTFYHKIKQTGLLIQNLQEHVTEHFPISPWNSTLVLKQFMLIRKVENHLNSNVRTRSKRYFKVCAHTHTLTHTKTNNHDAENIICNNPHSLDTETVHNEFAIFFNTYRLLSSAQMLVFFLCGSTVFKNGLVVRFYTSTSTWNNWHV